MEKYDPSSAKEKVRRKDKADRATMEQVMDPRTRMIVFKLLNRGAVREFNGCISTGKEANVYHCTMGEGENGAVKIYKTSILVFKDRFVIYMEDAWVRCGLFLFYLSYLIGFSVGK